MDTQTPEVMLGWYNEGSGWNWKKYPLENPSPLPRKKLGLCWLETFLILKILEKLVLRGA